MFAAKTISDQDSIQAAEAAAKDLDHILEGLPEESIDDEEEEGHLRDLHAQPPKYAGSSDEHELEDIMEEEESEEEEEAKEVTFHSYYLAHK